MKKMNLISLLPKGLASLAVAGAMIVATQATATSITFDYSSTPGDSINFAGDSTFSFSSGDNFVITLTHNGTGSADGLFGKITGTYTIGAITTVGTKSTASVTGGGTFVIHDGLGNDFTGNLTWVDITQDGTGGNLNVSGTLNLTGITYGGLNADLLTFLTYGQGNGANVLSFQFTPAVLLSALVGPNPHNTSFSGSASATPDGGATVALLGLGIIGIEALRRKVTKA